LPNGDAPKPLLNNIARRYSIRRIEEPTGFWCDKSVAPAVQYKAANIALMYKAGGGKKAIHLLDNLFLITGITRQKQFCSPRGDLRLNSEAWLVKRHIKYQYCRIFRV
tara:strand:+ start:30157 stop:30480 length:324 start_codon:yes stop_codon:yes gene_type:complete